MTIDWRGGVGVEAEVRLASPPGAWPALPLGARRVRLAPRSSRRVRFPVHSPDDVGCWWVVPVVRVADHVAYGECHTVGADRLDGADPSTAY